jgi:hypothetical protein
MIDDQPLPSLRIAGEPELPTPVGAYSISSVIHRMAVFAALEALAGISMDAIGVRYFVESDEVSNKSQ